MDYRIAEITLRSQIELPSFAAFACPAGVADVTLELASEAPPTDGEAYRSGNIVHRRTADGWFFHEEDETLGLLISADYTRLRAVRAADGSKSSLEERFIRIALECLLARRGYVSLHAACVEAEGRAIAFTAVSGMGKSTRAQAWIQACGARLVSGDRPLIRADGAEVCGVPWDGKEGCFRSVRYPLGAICEVRRSASVYARKLTFRQKQRLLMQQCFLPMWDTDTAACQAANIARLAAHANILRIFCGPTADDAKKLKQMLDAQLELEEASDMKAKNGFVLRNIVGEHMLMPTGSNIGTFKGAVLMNEVASFVWEKLQEPISRDDLLSAILDNYEVDEAKAAADLDALLEKMREYDVIVDE